VAEVAVAAETPWAVVMGAVQRAVEAIQTAVAARLGDAVRSESVI
jgi:hypothetical protein